MKIRFGVLARERAFAKAMRRIRPRLQSLTEPISHIVLTNPIHEAILVGITDDKAGDFFEEVPNSDGYFQVLAGCELKSSDEELIAEVFTILHRAATACPFSSVDREKIEGVFQASRKHVVGR